MTTSKTAPSNSATRSSSVQQMSAVRMPIDGPIHDPAQALTQLRQCDSTELHRARTHHRRALASLRDGGYSCLSEATRKQLADRLQNQLDLLNRALTPTPSASEADETDASSWSGRLWAFVSSLW